MLVFHELAYEGFILVNEAGIAGVAVYNDSRLMELMGAFDVVHVSGYATQVTGTSPQLFVEVEYSSDRNIFWPANSVFPIINAVNLSTSSETFFQGVHSQPELPRLAYSRLHLFLTGTNGRAFLRVWVTGRDRSRRSAGAKPDRRSRIMQ